MKATVITNAYYRDDNVAYQVARLTQEFAARSVELVELRNDSLTAFVSKNDVATAALGDFVVYLDKDKHVSFLLEAAGVRLFNSATAIDLCDDKMMTFVALCGKGVPMPDTVSAPLCYRTGCPDGEFPARVIQTLGLPVVVKEVFGSLGRGVYKADTPDELLALNRKLRHVPHLYQRFVAASCGKDTRVIVVGGRAICAMERRSHGDFRSNLALGGSSQAIELSPAFRTVAEKAATALGLDYCGIDLLTDADGSPLVCEVNSNAFFSGIEKATGINVAAAYADHILSVL